MPEGPLGLERVTNLGPLVSEDSRNIEIVPSQFEISHGKDIVYHIAEKEDIPDIIDEGLIGSKRPIEERTAGEEKGLGELMGPEDKFGPGAEAQRELNRALNEAKNVADSAMPRIDASELPPREDSVFFFPTVNMATRRAKSLDEPIIISVDFRDIPCSSFEPENNQCVSARIDIADNLFKLFFEESKGGAPVDREKEKELAMNYWESARLYFGGDSGSSREIYCSCDTPPKAIIEIAEVAIMPQEDIEEVFGDG